MHGALAVLCACALGLAHISRDSEAYLSPGSIAFSRYGRTGRLIAQRNDKWAMRTRYGKRAEFTMEIAPAPSRLPTADPGGTLSCRYTGVLSLYSCTSNGVLELRRNEDLSAITTTEIFYHHRGPL